MSLGEFTLYSVHPNNFECYYLRMLLHKIRGPTNFNDLKTIDSDLCLTYREACLKCGLLENDNQWEIAMAEGVVTKSAYQLRNLFAIIITFCNPSNPLGK